MHKMYILLTNIIIIQDMRDCGPKHFQILHFGPHAISCCSDILYCKVTAHDFANYRNITIKTVITRNTWVSFVRELSCCYHKNHIGPYIYRAWSALAITFPVKGREFWTHVILLRDLGLGYDRIEATKTGSDLNRSSRNENIDITI
jgi:hypothetical protein